MTGRPYAHCVYFIRSSITKVCKQRKNVCVTELIYVRLHEDGMSGNANMTFNFIRDVVVFYTDCSFVLCVGVDPELLRAIGCLPGQVSDFDIRRCYFVMYSVVCELLKLIIDS